MIEDLITVVVPTYNDAQYLQSAVDDILCQTYKNFELIIVNDGSTDNTSEILKEYSEKDNRIKVLNKENGGTGSALNLGFKNASGEFGTWISSDDNKHPEFLEKLVSFLKKNRDIEFVCSAFFSAYLDKNIRAYVETQSLGLSPLSITQQNLHDGICTGKWHTVDDWARLNNYSCMLGVCFMFTMRLKDKVGDYLNIPGEDYYMTMKMALSTRVAWLDTILGTHNNPVDSLSMTDRSCTEKANYLTRSLYQSQSQWNFNKIPKIASFYWGSDKMSFMRYMTIFSFKKYNPDWSIHLYVPKSVSNNVYWRTHGIDKHHSLDQVDYDGKDYYSRLTSEVAVKIITVDFTDTFLSHKAPEPHKSDLLTWNTLATKGGLWCDMDIVFRKSLNEMFQDNKQDPDTILCYDHRLREHDGAPEKPIGFLLSAPNNIFFKKAILESKKTYNPSHYQSIGTVILKRLGNTISDCKRIYWKNQFLNLDPGKIYHFHHQLVGEIFNEEAEIPPGVVGIHWYGGHPISQEFNKKVDHTNYLLFNNTMSKILKEVLS